jgi:hypothetical protein
MECHDEHADVVRPVEALCMIQQVLSRDKDMRYASVRRLSRPPADRKRVP